MIGLLNKQGNVVSRSGIKRASEAARVVLPSTIPLQNNPHVTVTFFFGRRGAGKTVSMVLLAYMLWQAYRRMKRNPIKIVSNFKVDFAWNCDPHIVDDLATFPMWAWRLLLLLDEIGAYFPSERAMSRAILDFGYFLQQIRKRGIEVFMTTQFPQEVSRRIVRQVDMFIEPEMIDHNRIILHKYDYWGIYTGIFTPKAWPPRREDEDTTELIWGAEEIYNSFNTNETIASLWGDSRERQIREAGWDLDSEDDSAVTPEPTFITGIDDMLQRELDRSMDNQVSVGALWNRVKGYKPEWESPREFMAWLIDKKWEVRQEGRGSWFASPPAGWQPQEE